MNASIANDSCSFPDTPCTSVGKYCITDDNVCGQCHNKPINDDTSYYTGPADPNNESDKCPWVCILGYGWDDDSVLNPCTQCSNGTYGPAYDNGNANACVSCSAGQYSNAGSGACSSCGGDGDWPNTYCFLNDDNIATIKDDCPTEATGSVFGASSKSDCYKICNSNNYCPAEEGYHYEGTCHYNNEGTYLVESETCTLTPNEFTITLYYNNGSSTTTSKTCTIGVPCDLSPDTSVLPPESGDGPAYSFDGWNIANDGSETNYAAGANTFTEQITKLYARWKKEIKFNANGGQFPDNSTIQNIYCYYNGNLNFPDDFPNPPDGYDISTDNIWYTNNDGTGTNYTHGDSDIFCNEVIVSELFPKWKYKVSYYKNCPFDSTNPATSDSICVKNASCELASVPSTITCANGWILDTEYWYQNPEGTGNSYASGTIVSVPAFSDVGDTTLYAKWTECEAGKWIDDNNECVNCNAGYYCEGNGQRTACPAGHTSPASSPAKTACYITTGNTGTKFCADGLCFKLPDIGNIHWGPPQP